AGIDARLRSSRPSMLQRTIDRFARTHARRARKQSPSSPRHVAPAAMAAAFTHVKNVKSEANHVYAK
ncbi:hypothetical protein, partial [Pseudomonas sp. CGJS7]|uniref:hypothetical protein n=1 Tax=Pseudomonas sp. CGJS7 TaxID=3109348 RepID=UPI00300A9046